MRIAIARLMVVGLGLILLTGCRSSGGVAKSWPWSKKKDGEPAVASAPKSTYSNDSKVALPSEKAQPSTLAGGPSTSTPNGPLEQPYNGGENSWTNTGAVANAAGGADWGQSAFSNATAHANDAYNNGVNAYNSGTAAVNAGVAATAAAPAGFERYAQDYNAQANAYAAPGAQPYTGAPAAGYQATDPAYGNQWAQPGAAGLTADARNSSVPSYGAPAASSYSAPAAYPGTATGTAGYPTSGSPAATNPAATYPGTPAAYTQPGTGYPATNPATGMPAYNTGAAVANPYSSYGPPATNPTATSPTGYSPGNMSDNRPMGTADYQTPYSYTAPATTAAGGSSTTTASWAPGSTGRFGSEATASTPAATAASPYGAPSSASLMPQPGSSFTQ